MWNSYNIFRRFCAFLIGIVFFLSGILKLLDPVGAGLVVAEYFRFFHVEFFVFMAKLTGSVLAFVETILGVALMAGLWRKVIAVITFIFLGFFTVITLILWIFNPVMDCGCFGEAIHLTHVQSFVKNIVLLGFAVIAFIPGRLGRPRKRKYVAFGIVTAFVLAFGIYSLLYIPLIDFTDFKPGARLEASAYPSGGEAFTSTFIYSRDGQEREFTLDNLPDSTWTYVGTVTVRLSNPDDTAVPLSFYDRSGEYRDDVAAEGNVMVFSVYNLRGMSGKNWRRLASAVDSARESGFTPVVLFAEDYNAVSRALAASFDQAVDGAMAAASILSNMYTADYKTLLTMNRSNGGAVYFKDGTLVMKWAHRALPGSEEMSRILSEDVADTVLDTTVHRQLVYEGLLVVAFGILFFV